MKSVEKTALRLDGVTEASAGWKTESIAVVTRPGVSLSREQIEAAYKDSGFKIVSVSEVKPGG